MISNQANKFFLVNLGCAKNLVEGEHLAGMLMDSGMAPAQDASQAQLLVANTCGFIQSAVNESIETILDMAAAKTDDQRLVVVGCLVGRYGKKLARSLPEADLLVSPGEVFRLLEHLQSPTNSRLAISPARGIFGSANSRAISTGPGWAYLRLSDGCDHKCAFCTIPRIRGRLRSRSIEDVLAEARSLAANGIRELNLVAQDLTAYGRDLGSRQLLPALLSELASISELTWIRLLYLHPDNLDKLLLESMAQTKKVLPYFDVPLQHIADPVLKAMGRRLCGTELRQLIQSIRDLLPGAVLRTTMLVGHPGEGAAEFHQLTDFVTETRFNHLGCFAYQPEAGTRSARLPAPEPETAQERQETIMAIQNQISQEKLSGLKDRKVEVLVLGPHPDSDLVWQGRMTSQAPEVDGEVIITAGQGEPGSIVLCRIDKTHDYDVEGSIV